MTNAATTSGAWLLTYVLIAPPLLWAAWEMLRAWRERRHARRILRETHSLARFQQDGDGLP